MFLFKNVYLQITALLVCNLISGLGVSCYPMWKHTNSYKKLKDDSFSANRNSEVQINGGNPAQDFEGGSNLDDHNIDQIKKRENMLTKYSDRKYNDAKIERSVKDDTFNKGEDYNWEPDEGLDNSVDDKEDNEKWNDQDLNAKEDDASKFKESDTNQDVYDLNEKTKRQDNEIFTNIKSDNNKVAVDNKETPLSNTYGLKDTMNSNEGNLDKEHNSDEIIPQNTIQEVEYDIDKEHDADISQNYQKDDVQDMTYDDNEAEEDLENTDLEKDKKRELGIKSAESLSKDDGLKDASKDVLIVERPHKEVKTWTKWSKWSECSVSCGTGQLSRSRQCTSKECAYDERESQFKPCTHDC